MRYGTSARERDVVGWSCGAGAAKRLRASSIYKVRHDIAETRVCRDLAQRDACSRSAALDAAEGVAGTGTGQAM